MIVANHIVIACENPNLELLVMEKSELRPEEQRSNGFVYALATLAKRISFRPLLPDIETIAQAICVAKWRRTKALASPQACRLISSHRWNQILAYFNKPYVSNYLATDSRSIRKPASAS